MFIILLLYVVDGHYIYLESSSPRSQGEQARLLSTRIPSAGARYIQNCSLEFWYHMYGADIGSLNVYIRSADGYGNRTSETLVAHSIENETFCSKLNLDLDIFSAYFCHMQ